MDFNPVDHPHRRYNPLLQQWVLVSPHRTRRPWQGKQEDADLSKRPEYDPKCYLCPGNTRANGETNPAYESTYVFGNDFAALLEEGPAADVHGDSELMQSQPVTGECRVICFSPRHDLTLPEMSEEAIGSVIDLWSEQYTELAAEYAWVQIFENKGAVMGCSNPHPHGQIWAQRTIPNEPAKELVRMRDYFEENGTTLLEETLNLGLLTEEEFHEAVDPSKMIGPSD